MRIVHVITKAEHGGAQSYVAALAAAQCNGGEEVTVISGDDGPLLAAVAAVGASTHVLTSLRHRPSLRDDRRALRALRSTLASLAPDVVHLHSSKPGLLGRIAARRLQCPAVYTAHGWPFQHGAGAMQRIQSFVAEFVAARFGGHVIVLTDHERALARRWLRLPDERMHVVPIGIPVDDSTPVTSHEVDIPVVVMVARFAAPKRFDRLIAALAANADLPWRAVLVGDGPDRSTAESLARPLGDRIHFAGDVDDVPDRLGGAQIALLASDYEGFPLALLEAMRAGCCCVADNLPGVRAMFGKDGGVIVPGHDAWPAVLRDVLADDALRSRCGEVAARRVRNEFDVASMAGRVERVYAAAISDLGRTAGARSSSR
jgi:glycosyltransferase involved in cell wall biosynthesis